MHPLLRTPLAVAAFALAAEAGAQITFYENEGYRGRAFTASRRVADFDRAGFNDRASSVVVESGRWEVCEDIRLQGHCVMLRKGSYETLRGLGLENRISSVRPLGASERYVNETPTPVARPNYEYRRRPNEAVFEAPVTSVRAVVGPPNERCWIERQQVAEPARDNRNVGGALLGGLLGGILGHQVGGGSGRDIATAGGAVAGAVIGSQVGGGSGGKTERDVRRCETTANTTPAYWDVTYVYQGVQHDLQMASPPGDTISVNRKGEPRQ